MYGEMCTCLLIRKWYLAAQKVNKVQNWFFLDLRKFFSVYVFKL